MECDRGGEARVAFPPGKRTWDLLAGHSKEASEAYWRLVNLYGMKDLSDFELGVATFSRYRRPFTAMQVLDGGLYAKLDVSTETDAQNTGGFCL